MKDNLERYVRDNRELFDDLEPSDVLWSKISGQLAPDTQTQKPIKNVFLVRWRAAASVVLLVGLGVLGYWFNNQYGIAEQPELALANPQLAKEVSNYNDMIALKQAELRNLTATDTTLCKEFQTELDQLDKNYQHLKTDLPQTPNQEVVIRAMIENLKWQIDLLNQQLDIIQKIKNAKNNHEKRTQPLV